MKYFICNLLVHIFIFILFTAVTLFFHERNRKRKTLHGFMYFAPLFFAIIAVVYALLVPVPRILDLKNVMSKKYTSYTGTVESVSKFKNTITVDDETFFINPASKMPKIGESIRVKYTGYSHYVMELESAETADYN